MILARVIGNAVSTIQHPCYDGQKVLVVQPVQVDTHTPRGTSFLAVDSVAAVDEALTYAGDHVRELPKVMTARVGRLWSVFRPLETAQLNTQEGRETWASHLAIAGLYVLAPLAAIGWWRVRDGWSRWMLGVMVFHVTLLGALFYGTPRFRAPAETVIVVMAAIGIHWLASLGACRQPRTSSSPPS